MLRRLAFLALLLVPLAASPRPATAGPFDLVYADAYNVTLCEGCGIMLAGLDFGLLVNTGTADITIDDLLGARFSVESSEPAILLRPVLNIPNADMVGAVHVQEALGSVVAGNEVLLTQLRENESFRNLNGAQFLAFQIERAYGDSITGPPPPYVGPVDFDVTMRMTNYELSFRLHVDVDLGPHSIYFLSATRAQRKAAVLAATPAHGTTWGTIKALYHGR